MKAVHPIAFPVVAVLLPALCACGISDSEDVGESTSALGGIAFVQVASSTPQSSLTSVATTFGQAQIAGDTNIVPICWFNASSNVTGVTDTKGNVYAVAAPVVRLSGTASCTMYYAAGIKAAAANANAVTVTFSSRALDPDVVISEYSGLSATPLDISASATGNSNSASSGSAVTTVAGDLIIGSDYLSSSTNGPGPGFTSRVITSPDSDILEDMIAGAPGAYAATAPTGGGWWLMQMAAFKAASVADAGASEAGKDASADAADAAHDSGIDASIEAGIEAGKDSGSEAGIDASVDSGSSSSGGGGGGGSPTLVQHVSGSNLRGNGLASPFCYYTALAAPSQAGNAIVVAATWRGSATLTVTDDRGDTYANNKSFFDAADNQSVGVASAFHVASGARNLSVCFSSNPGGWVEPMATELAGVVGIDGATAASGAGTSATPGTLTPSGSDILYQAVYTPGGPPSRFTAGAGSYLLSADIRDGWAGQYGPATAGAPSMALGSSVHWVTAGVLLRTGSAGSVPAGMRIVHLQHENLPTGTEGGGNGYYPVPIAIQFPSSGNLLVATIGGGSSNTPPISVTGITDGNANAWTQAGRATNGDCMSQIFYAPHATPASGLTLSVGWSSSQTGDSTAMLYDITGAAASPFDKAVGAGGEKDSPGNFTIPFTIAPAQAGELVFLGTPWDFDTAGGLLGGLLDTNTVSGESESGPYPVDENNGWGHALSTSTSPMSFTWVPLFGEIEFGINATVAAAFKPGP